MKKYDNYDATRVSFTDSIPSDYNGVMGVPITFLDKYNPDQFEILGATQRGCHDEVSDTKKYDDYWEVRQDGKKQDLLAERQMKMPIWLEMMEKITL